MFEQFQALPNWQKAVVVALVVWLVWWFFVRPQQMAAAAAAAAEAEAMTDGGYLAPTPPPEELGALGALERNFENEYGVGGGVQASDPAMVMWHARWCGHCQNTMPMWELFTAKYDGIYGIRFNKLDVDEHKDLAFREKVNFTPTIKFYPHGLENPSSAVVYQGDMNTEDLERFMTGYIKKWHLNHFEQ